jgi:1,4-alpha-glucan branching enzyme
MKNDMAAVQTREALTPELGELDLHLIAEGRHRELGRVLGAQPLGGDGRGGTRFAVWAPNARQVAVIGQFNQWDAQRHPLHTRGASGVWEVFVPEARIGELYKFAIWGPDGRRLPDKADPVARATEHPPGTASRIAPAQPFAWQDGEWMRASARRHPVEDHAEAGLVAAVDKGREIRRRIFRPMNTGWRALTARRCTSTPTRAKAFTRTGTR